MTKRKMMVVPMVILLTAFAIAAQEGHSPWHRITGIVVDSLGHPVVNATVCLKDLAGHSLRMKQTDRTGSFNFGLVNLQSGHEIYAEQRGIVSQKVPMQGSEAQRDIVVKLKLDSGNGTGH